MSIGDNKTIEIADNTTLSATDQQRDYKVTDVATFIAEFPTKQFLWERILNFPTDTEIQTLCLFHHEIGIIQADDNNFYIIKGDDHIVQGEKLHAELQAFNPTFMAHIHNVPIESGDSQNQNDEKLKFALNIPSPLDLATTIKGTDIRYIYTKYGRTTYRAIEDMMSLPEEEWTENVYSVLQNNLLGALRVAIKTAKDNGITEPMEGFNYVGRYMGRYFGCGFIYEPWSKVNDIRQPPIGFTGMKISD
jgi:hypothetical protein